MRNAVLLNAGAALAVHAGADGTLEDRLAAGIERATESVDSGRAQATLERWIQVSASA